MSKPSIAETIDAHADALLAIDGVRAVAQGVHHGEECIRVFVASQAAARDTHIPRSINGYRVTIQVSDAFVARPDDT